MRASANRRAAPRPVGHAIACHHRLRNQMARNSVPYEGESPERGRGPMVSENHTSGILPGTPGRASLALRRML